MTTRQLLIGDLIPVHLASGEWGCLQVTDLKRSGPGSLKNLIVGVLPWRGDRPPTPDDVRGLAVVAQGLTRIEIFTEGRAEVIGHVDIVPSGLPSNYRDHEVGVTRNVWGWRTALRAPESNWPADASELAGKRGGQDGAIGRAVR